MRGALGMGGRCGWVRRRGEASWGGVVGLCCTGRCKGRSWAAKGAACPCTLPPRPPLDAHRAPLRLSRGLLHQVLLNVLADEIHRAHQRCLLEDECDPNRVRLAAYVWLAGRHWEGGGTPAAAGPVAAAAAAAGSMLASHNSQCTRASARRAALCSAAVPPHLASACLCCLSATDEDGHGV